MCNCIHNQRFHGVIGLGCIRCRYTSGRTHLTPLGNRGYLFVKIGNILSGRTVLLCLLATWCGLRWLVEQPDGSFLPELPRYQLLFGLMKVRSLSMLHVFSRMLILSTSYRAMFPSGSMYDKIKAIYRAISFYANSLICENNYER